MLDRLHMHIVDILLFDDHDRYRSSLQPQLQDALRVVGESRNHAVFCTTFNPFEFGRSGFPQSAIRALTQAFAVPLFLSGINEFLNVVKSQAESLSASSRMEQKVL